MSQLSGAIAVLATLAQGLTAPVLAPRPTLPSPPVRARAAPFERLSTPPMRLPAPQSSPRVGEDAVRLGSKVICGMVVVPADSAVDPRMVKLVPTDVTFAMRVVAPPVCRD